MPRNDRSYSFDANLGLSDGAASYSATGYAQYAGADGIVDFGGNQNVSVALPAIADTSTLYPQRARIDATIEIDVTAGTFTGTTLFKIYAVASNDPTFGSGNVVTVGMLAFGNAGGAEYLNALTTATPDSVGGSMYEMPICMQQNGTPYQYLKLYNVVANSAALTYKAFVAVAPEP
ncbi:MAG TPA: hypothetical protein VMU08_08230 [Rhizomicrobium sp.]|nr:hypothetical protein [Rhizomicrobium sp.]